MNIDFEYCKKNLLKRENESHKGDYGHLLLICGSKNMPGAAVLATGAALHSGCGLVTIHSVLSVCNAVSYLYPSAILSIDEHTDCFSNFPSLEKYDVVAIGPGLGKSEITRDALLRLLKECRSLGKRMLLDADALNLLSEYTTQSEQGSDFDNRAVTADSVAFQPGCFRNMIPSGSVMTPHDGELMRLCAISGSIKTLSEKLNLVKSLSKETGCIVVSKGYRTNVVGPNGELYVNTTGGPGLAKGGSGDVLSGLIAGLMARGYETLHAANLGVWIHGYTGDYLTEMRTAESFDSKDLIDALYNAFKSLF